MFVARLWWLGAGLQRRISADPTMNINEAVSNIAESENLLLSIKLFRSIHILPKDKVDHNSQWMTTQHHLQTPYFEGLSTNTINQCISRLYIN